MADLKKTGVIYLSVIAGRAVNKYVMPKIDEKFPPRGEQWYEKWSNIAKLAIGLAIPIVDYFGYIPEKYKDGLLVFGAELFGDVVVDPPTEVPVANLEPVEYVEEHVPVETGETKKKVTPVPVVG